VGVREKYRLLKRRIKEILCAVKSYRLRFREVQELSEKTFVLWGIPEYGNLGDQAITYAEIEFLRKYVPGVNILRIPEELCVEYIWPMKRLAQKKCFVFISHGGGNMGTLYKYQEQRRQMLIRHIKNNPIVVFPQSVDYSEGSKEHLKARKLYYGNRNLQLYARDYANYKKMKALFPKVNVDCVPDIVSSLSERAGSGKRKGILLCLRADREKNESSKQSIEKLLCSIPADDREFLDTYGACYAAPYGMQKEQIEKFWERMQHAELVITDRLHGMIFSMITNTPCIAFDNTTGKVAAFYDAWLQDSNGIFMCGNNIEEALTFADNCIKKSSRPNSYICLADDFFPLIQKIMNINKGL
jgi:pyruvyl transferase EpsI